jgi:hypothetical protein
LKLSSPLASRAFAWAGRKRTPPEGKGEKGLAKKEGVGVE